MSKMPIPSDRVLGAFQCIFAGASQTLNIASASTATTSFASTTRVVRVFPTEDCFAAFGTAPDATTTGMFLPGGVIQFFGVVPAEKMAIKQSATTGSCYITEGA